MLVTGMGRKVGRGPPCALFARKRPRTGARGVTRLNKLTKGKLRFGESIGLTG